MDLGIKNHVALVTGGAKGIGRAICLALAEEGCRVVVWSRDLKSTQAVVDEITAKGGVARAAAADVADRKATEKVIDDTFREFGEIQILVNNAGFSRDASFVKMTDEQWHEVIDTNLHGIFYSTRAVVPIMIKQGYGRIINISSRVHLGEINKANYVAAKGGVVSFTRGLSLELAGHGITVNSVAPGMIETERLVALPQFETNRKRAIENTPVRRIGLPREVADGVLYLASASSGFCTGNILYITGGRY